MLTHVLHYSLHRIICGARSVCLGHLCGAQVLEEGEGEGDEVDRHRGTNITQFTSHPADRMQAGAIATDSVMYDNTLVVEIP